MRIATEIAFMIFCVVLSCGGVQAQVQNNEGSSGGNVQNNNYNNSAERYRICIGEFASKCPQGYVYLSCGDTVANWARQQNCKSFTAVKLNDISGNRCGYYTADVSCIR